MTNSLSSDAIALYRRDGFLFPIDVSDASEAAAWRRELEALEARYAEDPKLPLELNRYLRVNAHVVLPIATRIAFSPRVLDAVEGVLGPDLLLWSAEFFIKPARSDKIVSWHQDLTYWGLGETDHEVTAWIALSPVTQLSGCMRFVAGSHHNAIVPHADTFAADNLLSRGQELAVDVDEGTATNVVLMPGQMSLHHGRMFHASGPNHSSDRRIGLALRFITPDVRQEIANRDYAMLARGVDRFGHFTHMLPPDQPFSPEALSLYDTILQDQAAALSAGSERELALYSASAT